MIDIVVGIGKDFLVQDAIVSKDEYTHNVSDPPAHRGRRHDVMH